MASAPYFSIRSMGLTPLPLDLDMRVPSLAKMVAYMTTSWNGISSRKYVEAMIMRATHSAMMSRAVNSAAVG